MVWFKVDDTFALHPKALAAGNVALGLWVRAGAWSSQQLTEGFVPVFVLPALGGRKKDAETLVSVGLWLISDGGYQFHQWDERQPSKEEVESNRESNRRRQALVRSPELREAIRLRDADRCRYCGITVKWTDRRGPQGGTYDHVDPNVGNDADNLVVACRSCNARKGHRTPTQARMPLLPEPRSDLGQDSSPNLGSGQPPTRPDPTRPTTEELPSDKPKPRPRRRSVVGFELTDGMRNWAAEKEPAVDLERETEKFVDHFTGTGDVKSDWGATWRNWIRRAAENGPRIHVPAQRPLRAVGSTTDQRVEAGLALARQYAEEDQT